MTKSILKNILNILIILALLSPCTSFGAEKKPKKPPIPVTKQEAAITDANITAYVKKADELLKKGDLDSSLRIYQKAYDYTKDVLITTKLLQAQYEKIINDPSTEQNDREEIILKQKRMKQIVPKYIGIKESTLYSLGYIFAKKGDSERARKYLSEVLETVPFSLKTDSLWMKTKTLLLSQYGLEGEF
jgi:tetratricopeptide (TPR) repeat protein